MALPGKGFLAIWNDVAPEHEAEWLEWHTVEHMPERVGVPGFLGGRRYGGGPGPIHRMFTLYLGEAVETFSSLPYLERLNSPTPWTTRLAPHFRNFLRGACRVIASESHGLGGLITTVQIEVRDRSNASDAARGRALVTKLKGIKGVTGAHIGLQEAGVSGVQTKEKALRGDKTTIDFEGVVMIEGLTRAELDAGRTAFLAAINDPSTGLAAGTLATYDLAFSLDKAQL